VRLIQLFIAWNEWVAGVV